MVSLPLARVVEEAADRVFMAARLFVRFFNQRGGSLQKRILELLELADAADHFHKKTVTASVGGGVASVAGSITTITGLILAPFTAGTSLIVTAVGIGVATAGGVASASANITDTVHSKTDRKKVEAMIQHYQEEIKDIKECLEFLQVTMRYSDHLNQRLSRAINSSAPWQIHPMLLSDSFDEKPTPCGVSSTKRKRTKKPNRKRQNQLQLQPDR